MFYIGLILFIIGLVFLVSTLLTLKRFKQAYGDELGEFLENGYRK